MTLSSEISPIPSFSDTVGGDYRPDISPFSETLTLDPLNPDPAICPALWPLAGLLVRGKVKIATFTTHARLSLFFPFPAGV